MKKGEYLTGVSGKKEVKDNEPALHTIKPSQKRDDKKEAK